ncbi:signal peptidase II [Micromonospora sp. A202]|uniref:signal peptidase II n=1 Tax=Micromonospora sp. A202 TaxID=2572899 RepID=UPI001151AB16|nr:signal peptidase II [Micromonospora sp. A202]TQJ23338.1 signal peptidase II [Micromonospora sp. A202]
MFRAVVLIAAVVLAADQLTKYWAESALSDGQTITVVGELLQLRLVYNPGAAFSIGAAYTWIFAVFAAAAVVAVTVVARRVMSRAWAVALGLVLGGATTHLLDRLFREPGFARGHVVDFIDYAGFFVGNVADIALVVGVGVVMVLNLRGIPLREETPSGDEQVASRS